MEKKSQQELLKLAQEKADELNRLKQTIMEMLDEFDKLRNQYLDIVKEIRGQKDA